jgi:hypothetical protein
VDTPKGVSNHPMMRTVSPKKPIPNATERMAAQVKKAIRRALPGADREAAELGTSFLLLL